MAKFAGLGLGLGLGCCFVAAEMFAQSPSEAINAIRLSSSEDRTRVWIELSAPVEYTVFQLENPPRVVIDLEAMRWNVDRQNLVTQSGYVTAVRFGQNSDQKSRLVLDLKDQVNTKHSLFLAPYVGADHRLVVELYDQSTAAAAGADDGTGGGGVRSSAVVPTAYLTLGDGTLMPVPNPRPLNPPERPDVDQGVHVVVIDAGHGGKDPGASGGGGLIEKNITLAVAKALAAALDSTGRYRAVLTRDSDSFIPLRERPKIGRDAGGDLFISLHADSASSASLRGASVYTLSETSSDKESAALAKRENDSDAVAGIEIAQYPQDIRNILLDLAMRRTLNESSRFAEIVVQELRENWRVLPRRPHRFAGFAVLSSADMPSVLVEMGYLTNASDIRMLGSAQERTRFVRAMVGAVDQYFETLGGSF